MHKIYLIIRKEHTTGIWTRRKNYLSYSRTLQFACQTTQFSQIFCSIVNTTSQKHLNHFQIHFRTNQCRITLIENHD